MTSRPNALNQVVDVYHYINFQGMCHSSVSKLKLNPCYISGLVLGTDNTKANKTDKFPKYL